MKKVQQNTGLTTGENFSLQETLAISRNLMLRTFKYITLEMVTCNDKCSVWEVLLRCYFQLEGNKVVDFFLVNDLLMFR